MTDDHEDHHREEHEGGEGAYQDVQLLLHTQHDGGGLDIKYESIQVLTRPKFNNIKLKLCYLILIGKGGVIMIDDRVSVILIGYPNGAMGL